MPLRFLTPFAFLALLPLGAWLGGAWTFLAAIATPVCLAALDPVLGSDSAEARPVSAMRWVPRITIVLQLLATGFAAAWVLRPVTSLLEAVGLALSAGVTTGVFGFLAAHELVHSRDRRERAFSLLFLASVFYMHFRIAHLYGHHRRAATAEDPASARLGEGLYAFLVRSIGGQFREACAFESRRRSRAGAPGIANRMFAYLTIELLLLVGLILAGARVLAFVLATAIIAVLLLESFNYVAHYGLSRTRTEPLGPQHSWNSRRRMNNAALFNMGRHGDHHRRPSRSYERLRPVAGAAELPAGYAAALLTALVPPLWRRMMDPRIAALRSTAEPRAQMRSPSTADIADCIME